MAEFDPHRIIRKLAEAEWPCRNCGGSGIRPPDAARVEEVHRCLTCYGGRYSVPFASLRVTCRRSVRPLLVIGEVDDTDKEAELAHQAQFHQDICLCKGLRWIPEPEVKKACWELAKVEKLLDEAWVYSRGQTGLWEYSNIDGELVVVLTAEEAMLRAPLAWLDRQRKEVQP